MELLPGETLAERLHRVGRFPTTDVLPIARQMAAGLAAAHRAGVVHRDFKSHNVMLVEASAAEQEPAGGHHRFRPGAAERSGRGRRRLDVATEAAEISGTPAYMAPEQVEGGAVTPATDVYAFGVVLYELVTGVCPFVADTPMRTAIKRLQNRRRRRRVHVPDLDPRWEATILRCLARQPADRFSNVVDVVASLEGAGVEQAAASRPPSRRWAVGAGSTVPRSSWPACGWLRVVCGGTRPAGITSIAVLPFENVEPRSRAGVHVRWHQRSAHQPSVAAAWDQGRREQFLVAVTRQEGRSARGRARARRRRDSGRQGCRTRRPSVNQRRADQWDRSARDLGRSVRSHRRRTLLQVPEEISRDVAAKLQVAARRRSAAHGRVGRRQRQGVRAAAQGPFPPREGKHGGPAAGRRIFPPGHRGGSELRAGVCRSLRHLSEPDQQR